jgi:hypothetical protein
MRMLGGPRPDHGSAMPLSQSSTVPPIEQPQRLKRSTQMRHGQIAPARHWPKAIIAVGVLLTLAWIGLLVWFTVWAVLAAM